MASPAPLCLHLAPNALAPRIARAGVVRALGLSGEAADDVALLMSEAVTNSVLHAGLAAGDRIMVRAWQADEATIRVEVSDEGGRFRRPSAALGPRHGGRGLLLIQRLSRDWGVDHNGVTRTWFTYDRHVAAASLH